MSSSAGRVLLVEWDGASYDVLVPLAARGVMPHVAGLLESAALLEPAATAGLSERAARATFWTGSPPAAHGMLDDWRLEAGRARLVPNRIDRLARPTLWQRVEAAWGPGSVVELEDFDAARFPWDDVPSDFASLARRAATTEAMFERLAQRAVEVDRRVAWQLMTVRLRTLRGLRYHLGNALATGDPPGANPRWVAVVDRLLQSMDACLGRLVAMARDRGATIVVVSPSGVVPFRGQITLSELFIRAGLLRLHGGSAALSYHLGRLGWKARRQLGRRAGGSRLASAVLPIDWRTSNIVVLHGQSAALAYLNTPERFGRRAPVTESARDRTAEAAIGALVEARHPATGQTLFVDAFRTDERFGPAARRHGWPEVIGIPAAGFTTRHRADRKGRLVREGRRRTGAAGGPGLVLIDAPQVSADGHHACSLEEAAGMVADLVGLSKIAGAWAKRSTGSLFDGSVVR